MNIIDAIHDPALFRPLFKDLATWRPWLVVLKAMFGLKLDRAEKVLFLKLSGRETAPRRPVLEAWWIFGRRAGKSFIVALLACFLACFFDYRPFLGPGERGIVMVISCDRRQSRVIMRYITAILNSVPMLRDMIARQDAESIDLTNGITIEITTASFRSIRGYTIVTCICDEIAFWRAEDSANPAEEILTAVRPAMSTVPNAMLIGLGTPYRKAGVMYEAQRRYYGKDSDVLVLQAPTRVMNPTVSQRVIDRAFEHDPANASAEYMAEFRNDVGSFLDGDVIESAIEPGCRERAPLEACHYQAFCDVSGGRGDAFTLAIAHRDEKRKRVVLDVCRGVKPPFDPATVVKDFAALLKTYRCHSVRGDEYGAEWVVSAFRSLPHNITYLPSEHTKNEVYLESLPLFMTGGIDLLDVQSLTMQLLQLERRTSRSGRDTVQKPPNGHDDYANAACGALILVAQQDKHAVSMVKLVGI